MKHQQLYGSITSSGNADSTSEADTDTIAGETTSNSGGSGESSSDIDVVGLAVFKGDILVGELTATETICHLIVTNDLEECIFSIPSPFDEDNSIDLYVTMNDKTKNNVEFVNGAPFITSDVKLNARILSAGKNTNYFTDDNLKLIKSYANSYVKNELEKYFYKTSKDYEADIALMGKHAVRHFTTWDEWVNYDWLDNYTNAFFNVNVDVNIVSSYLIS